MIKLSQGIVILMCALVVAALLMLATSRQRALAATSGEAKAAGNSNYTVVMTEGHNLLVTDNSANKLYFYTIDKDKAIGSPLKLRASLDLTKVGDEEIKITPHNVEK